MKVFLHSEENMATYFDRRIMDYKHPEPTECTHDSKTLQDNAIALALPNTNGTHDEIAKEILLSGNYDEYIWSKFKDKGTFLDRFSNLLIILKSY